MRLKFTYGKLFVLLILNLQCSNFTSSDDTDLLKLKSWMTGSFNSQEQSRQDSNYLNINLEMVEIFKNRNDGLWLYVEQAVASSVEKPYRQRVYRLTKSENDKFESAVFLISNPEKYIGAWKNEQILNQLTFEEVSIKDGCSIILDKLEDSFIGKTIDKKCPSELQGASYTTSEVYIEENVLVTWDRGFNKNNKQVWGAITGPYIFKKLKNY
jgi:hypothetical protein